MTWHVDACELSFILKMGKFGIIKAQCSFENFRRYFAVFQGPHLFRFKILQAAEITSDSLAALQYTIARTRNMSSA